MAKNQIMHLQHLFLCPKCRMFFSSFSANFNGLGASNVYLD